MAGPKLTTVTRTQGNNQALKDGTVKPKNFELQFIEVNPLIDAFRRMVRGLGGKAYSLIAMSVAPDGIRKAIIAILT